MTARLDRSVRPLRQAMSGAPVGPSARAGLANVQVLRGVAASAVLAGHTLGYMHLMRGAWMPARAVDEMLGILGVAIFFAISGTLMAGLIRRDDPWTFLAHRILRLFPAYFGIVALAGLVFAALRMPFSLNVFALTLAPTGPRSFPLGVEWTLLFEMSFYVGLVLLALAGLTARLVPLALAWLALLVLGAVLLPHASATTMAPAPYRLPLSPACLAFAGGLLLPGLVARGWMRPSLTPWLILPALALVFACLVFEGDTARRWLAGLAAVLIVGTAVAGRQVRPEGVLRRAAIRLGDWSYVLYLVHVPVIVLVMRYAPAGTPDPLLWLTAITAALGLTALLGPLDVALYRRLRRGIDRASPLRLRQGLTAYLCLFLGFALYGSAESGQTAWREARARAALAALPPQAFASPEEAESAIVAQGLGFPATLRGGIESYERFSRQVFILDAWAFDPEAPDAAPMLAAFCDGATVAVERPGRLRPALAAQAGLEAARGRRVGYRMKVPDGACAPGTEPVAVLIGPEGRLAVLNRIARPVAVSKAE